MVISRYIKFTFGVNFVLSIRVVIFIRYLEKVEIDLGYAYMIPNSFEYGTKLYQIGLLSTRRLLPIQHDTKTLTNAI